MNIIGSCTFFQQKVIAVRLFYGKDRSVELTVPPQSLVISNTPGTHSSSEAAVQAALNAPLGLPPLGQCVTPDDKIVLPVGADIPCESTVLSQTVGKLIEIGIQPENITVLFWENEQETSEDGAEKRIEGKTVAGKTVEGEAKSFEKPLPPGVVVHRHRTSDPQSYEILATTESGDPLAFARPLVEADVVIPIGTFEPTIADQATSEHLGIFSALYPRFSTQDVQERFKNPVLFNLLEKELPDLPDAVVENLTESPAQPLDEYAELEEMSQMRWEKISGVKDQRPPQKGKPPLTEQERFESRSPEYYRTQRKSEVEQSGWSLGVVLSMIVVPGPGDSIDDVYFGLPNEVEKKVELRKQTLRQQGATSRGIGKLRFQTRPKTVICCFNGAEKNQTWARLADLLESAAFQGADHCDLFLLADVSQDRGPGFELLREAADLLAGDLPAVSAKLYREKFRDSIAALRWIRVLQNHRIYWLSNLPDEIVESLGAIPVHNESEMNRALAPLN